MSQEEVVNMRLMLALEEAGYPESVQQQAWEGYWSDFGSPHAFPKLELVKMLEADGHHDLAQRVKDGDFDG